MTRPRYDRRAVLGLGVSTLSTLAGCNGRSSSAASCRETPDPVTIRGKSGDAGGMVVGVHPGPVGVIFYCNHEPSGHPNPARFASLNPGFFSYYFAHKRKGWHASALYVTDYSTIDYTVEHQSGHDVITSKHTPLAAAMTDATAATYVVDSSVHGTMGPAFVPFSKQSDARSFASEYNGHTRTLDQISPGVFTSG